MKQFVYTTINPVCIRVRLAGLLIKATQALDSTMAISKASEKSAAGTKLMALMGLGIKQGKTVHITVEGCNEDTNVL